MKKSIKVALAIIMALVFSITCATVAVFATADETNAGAGKVCRIGAEGTGTYYETIAAAVSAAEDGDVITVIKDTTIGSSIGITEDITLTSEKTVTVTCNESNALKIGATGTPANVTVAGNLQIFASETYNQVIQMIEGKAEIKDNVYLKSYQDTINLGSSATANKAEVIIWGGTVEATNTTQTKGAIYLGKEGSKATIKGGTIKGNTKSAAVRLFGKNAELNVEGGTLTATTNTIYCEGANNQKLNISGDGRVEATTQHTIKFTNKAKVTTNISGGTVTAPKITVMYDGEASGTLELSGNGRIETTSANQCVYLNNNSGYHVDFTMTGGTLSAKGDNSLYLYGQGSANVNISGGEITGKDGIVRSNRGTNIINISGGTITAETQTLHSSAAGTKITISGDANITATSESSYALRVRGGNHTVEIKGGTITAPNNTVNIEGADNTVNITGGSIVANQKNAINGSDVEKSEVNISGDAKIYAGKQAIVAGAGLTFNISGGLIDVSNEYTPDDISSQYAVVTNSGNVNITSGKFIVGGSNDAAQVIYQGGNSTGTTTVNGGLFINKNTANTKIFSDKVNYVKGNIIYGENITNINSTTEATKGVTVKYEDNDYNFYTRYAATDAEKGAMLDGASVRLTAGSTGLRFTSEFAKVDGATYGTIIVPASYLATIDAFTVEALTTKYGENGFLNIVANDGMDVDGDTVTIRAAITNLDTYDNYETIFAAVSYVIIDGEYYYTAFDMANNARSVEYVANEALADTEADYTEAQEEILRGFLRQDA